MVVVWLCLVADAGGPAVSTLTYFEIVAKV